MNGKPIPNRKLGKSGPMVPALGFGTMGLCYQTYGPVPSDEERFKVLDRAFELGARHWDCSDLYGDGEELIGKWFRRTGNRNEIILATKFGFIRGSKTFEVDSSAAYCKNACAESLRKLGVESIDLYYLHSPNSKTPIEETMRALAELQAEGKIKHIGLSSVSSKTLRRAVRVAPVVAVQCDYSLFMLDIEGPAGTDLLATCRDLGTTLVAAMPLGRGMLTSSFSNGGSVEGIRTLALPRFMEGNREKNMKIVGAFKELADKKGCTLPQLAIAFLLKQGDHIIPIPGTKKMKYLEENWGSLDVCLTDEDEAEIRKLVENSEIAGGALPPRFADHYFRDTVEEA